MPRAMSEASGGTRAQVISTARTCNLILIVLDCLKPISHKKLIEHELEGFGIRLNKKPPAITFRKKEKGGINFTTTIANPKLDLDGAPLVSGFLSALLTVCAHSRHCLAASICQPQLRKETRAPRSTPAIPVSSL
jgi:hypothetical protein